MKSLTLLALATLIWPALAGAQTAPSARPASAPSADLLAPAVDPYDAPAQRTKFLAAAGVDGELDAKEFEADRDKGGGFAQPFDRWDRLRAFDANRNGSLDWFEADAARQALRKMILARFDSNHDGKLTADERPPANRLLAEGPGALAASAPAGRRGGLSDELVRKYDTDGDGLLTPRERMLAFAEMREMRRRQQIAQLDTDGDGRLTPDQRLALRREQFQRNPNAAMGAAIEDWLTRQFDTNGDALLDDDERAAMTDFGDQFRQMGESLRNAMLDGDGDGKVSPEEQRQAGMRMAMAGVGLMARVNTVMDTDGNGAVSPEEREAFNQRAADGMARWLDKQTAKLPAEAGRLTHQGREQLLDNIHEDMLHRIQVADANADNRLDGGEFQNLMIDMMVDMEMLPTEMRSLDKPADSPASQPP